MSSVLLSLPEKEREKQGAVRALGQHVLFLKFLLLMTLHASVILNFTLSWYNAVLENDQWRVFVQNLRKSGISLAVFHLQWVKRFFSLL